MIEPLYKNPYRGILFRDRVNPTPPAPVIAGLGLSEAGLGQVLGVCCVCVCFFFFFLGGGGAVFWFVVSEIRGLVLCS